MSKAFCPYCREEIHLEAVNCKHCHTRLRISREEKIISAVAVKLNQIPPGAISIPSGSACEAACHSRFAKHRNKALLTQCLDDCKAAEAVALLAEKLQRELFDSFLDIVWGGGDIDPVPLEKNIRERFAQPKVK